MDASNSLCKLAARWAGRAAIFALAFTVANPARSVTLDFSAFEITQGSYLEDGFELSSNYRWFKGIHNGNVYVFPGAWNQTNTLKPLASTVFDLISMDLTEINDNVGPQTVEFTGNLLGGGTVSQTFTTDGPWGFQTFTFGPQFTGLTSLVWDHDNPPAALSYDNIVVQEGVVSLRRNDWSGINQLYVR